MKINRRLVHCILNSTYEKFGEDGAQQLTCRSLPWSNFQLIFAKVTQLNSRVGLDGGCKIQFAGFDH